MHKVGALYRKPDADVDMLEVNFFCTGDMTRCCEQVALTLSV